MCAKPLHLTWENTHQIQGLRWRALHYVDWPRKHCQCYLSQTN